MNRTQLFLFRFITVLVSPVLVLIVLELILRVVGFGYNMSVFVEEKGLVRSNWPFTFKYFPWSMARPMKPVQFEVEKRPGSLRIFVLGGSAAQGFPEEAFGMAGQLQVMLEQAVPNRNIEVINTAITALNSHGVLPVAKACLKYDPDLLVVYVGNNEVVGPHGAASVFSGFSNSLFLVRVGDALKSLRLYQMLVMLTGKHRSPTGSWKGMEFFLNNTLYPGDERLSVVYDHFACNLDDLVTEAQKSNCPVILSTVGANLLDNPPFASRKPNHAENQYVLGFDHLEAGNYAAAQLAFRQARDWDGLRFRVDSELNQVIRGCASKFFGYVTLVDAERSLSKSDLSVQGVPGDSLFYDHVHLSFAGNYTVAKELAKAVVANMGDGMTDLPTMETVASTLAYTEWDRLKIARQLAERLLNKPPFTHQWKHRDKQLARQREIRRLAGRSNPDLRESSRRLYQAALTKNPDDPDLKFRLSSLLAEMDQSEAAHNLLEEVIDEYPYNHEALFKLGELSAASGNFDEAERHLTAILNLNPFAIEVRNAYLKLLFEAGRIKEAIDYNEDLVEDHSKDPDIRYVFALILNSSGKKQEALRQLREAVAIDPRHKESRSLILKLVRNGGDLVRAEGEARAWTKADPGSSEAHSRLAEVLTERENYKAATEEYLAAINLNPDFVIARSRYIQTMEQLGRIHEAIRFLGMQLKEDPDILEGHSMLGLTLDAVGRKQQGIALLRVGLLRDPNSLKCLRELAWILATTKSDSSRNGIEAVELAERLVKLAPNDPDFRNVLAAAYAETRQFGKAIAEAQQGLRLARATNNQELSGIIAQCLAAFQDGQPLRAN